MKKKLQIFLLPETWSMVESLATEANTNFDVGSISYSDVINELVLNSKIDIKTLQRKHTDLRRSIRAIAAQSTLDIDSAIKALLELKSTAAKNRKNQPQEEVAS